MKIVTNFVAVFDSGTEAQVSVKEAPGGSLVLEIKQGDDIVWLPIGEAKEFVEKLNLWAIDNLAESAK